MIPLFVRCVGSVTSLDILAESMTSLVRICCFPRDQFLRISAPQGPGGGSMRTSRSVVAFFSLTTGGAVQTRSFVFHLFSKYDQEAVCPGWHLIGRDSHHLIFWLLRHDTSLRNGLHPF